MVQILLQLISNVHTTQLQESSYTHLKLVKIFWAEDAGAMLVEDLFNIESSLTKVHLIFYTSHLDM